MIERPSQLRARLQAGKENDPGWYFVHRRLSIYVTWALLHTPIGPNAVTGLMMLCGALGAAMLACPIGWVNAAAFGVLYLSFLLDKVDGEVARYRGRTSVHGLLLDRLHHLAIEPLVFLAAAWKDYATSGSLGVWTAGWAIVVLGNLVDEHQHLSAYILFKHVRGTRRRPSTVVPEAPAHARLAYQLLRPLKAFRMFIVVVPALAVSYAVEAFTGLPAIRAWLYLSVAGLSLCAVLQFVWYYSRQLDAEIAAQSAQLADPPPPEPARPALEVVPGGRDPASRAPGVNPHPSQSQRTESAGRPSHRRV